MSRDGSGTYSKPAGTTAVSGEVISSTSFNTLIDDIVDDLNLDRPIAAGGTGASTASGARTNLGLGSISTQDASNVDITGGSITGITDLAIADGGTAASTAADARSNLAVPGLNGGNTFTGDQVIQSSNTGAGAGPQVVLYRNSGSPEVGDNLGILRFRGRNGADTADVEYGYVRGELDSPTGGSESGTVTFGTIRSGSGGDKAHIGSGLWMQGATGGDQGAGTINATDVYDDGSALCAPIEEAVTGSYDGESWRKFAPHSGLDAYEALKGRGRNPQSADDYAAEIDAHKGIPGMWNKAEWQEITSSRRVSVAEREERLMLALDLAALAIRDLAKRVQALESA